MLRLVATLALSLAGALPASASGSDSIGPNSLPGLSAWIPATAPVEAPARPAAPIVREAPHAGVVACETSPHQDAAPADWVFLDPTTGRLEQVSDRGPLASRRTPQ